MDGARLPYDHHHPQLAGVLLAPGSRPIDERSWREDAGEEELVMAATRLAWVRARIAAACGRGLGEAADRVHTIAPAWPPESVPPRPPRRRASTPRPS